MILSSNTKILIVPDFGEDVGDGAMTALKESIEAAGDYSVNVVDLLAMVKSAHREGELTDARMIELSARRLESLCDSDELLWNEPEDFYTEQRHDHPDTVVVFGKSAMLAGGIGRADVLFINPEYEEEWPWKKQYYTDWRLVGQFRKDICDYERDRMTIVTWNGTEAKIGCDYSIRYGMFTRDAGFGEFWDHYPRLAEVDESLDGDTKGLAAFICRFADGRITNPLEEVYKTLSRFPRIDNPDFKWICRFSEPLEVGGFTILGIQFGAPMANGQSCYKLKLQNANHNIPLESFNTRKEYNLLRDAILCTRSQLKEMEKPRKRILIVPDYFTPYDAPCVRELYDRLSDMDYHVAVFMAQSTLEKSRQALERRCKSKPFDLIVTFETGCLLAARVAKCPRIFVNPDWAAGEWMALRLGDNRLLHERRGADKSGPVYTYILNADEIEMAREMAERSNIRRGAMLTAGWFTEDAVESHLPVEHLKRFNTSTMVPAMRLDTDEGLEILANQIYNILTIDDE